MGKLLRLIGLFFVFGPLSAMFSEPFFQALYDRLGWDTEDLAGPMFRLVDGMTSLPYFWHGSIAMLCLGLGVWLHYLATLFDRRSSKDTLRRLSGDIFYARKGLDVFIDQPQRNPRIRVDNPTVPIGDTAKARSVLASLKALGIPVPDIGPKVTVGQARMLTEYFSTVYPFVGSDQGRECKSVAKEFLTSRKTKAHSDQQHQ